MPPKIVTKTHFPATLEIDGQSIDVRVARLTNAQYDAFAVGLDRWKDPRGSAPVSPEDEAARRAVTVEWMQAALRDHLVIEPGQIEHDGHDVTDATDLLSIYGGRPDVVSAALLTIYFENILKVEQKKTYKLVLDSLVGSSNGRTSADDGTAPDSTAAPASENDSAPSVAVTESSAPTPSGMTAP